MLPALGNSPKKTNGRIVFGCCEYAGWVRWEVEGVSCTEEKRGGMKLPSGMFQPVLFFRPVLNRFKTSDSKRVEREREVGVRKAAIKMAKSDLRPACEVVNLKNSSTLPRRIIFWLGQNPCPPHLQQMLINELFVLGSSR